MSMAEFLYTTATRFPWLRAIINRMILAILPTSVRVGNARIMLNPQDPVISGALTFGVYEKSEIELMRRFCRPGRVMVDIGANVGLYTAIAGLGVGPSGRVIAFEPEPESFRFLQNTVSANELTNTLTVQAAASSENGKTRLFTSSANRGDHRMYWSDRADGSVEVDVLRPDDYLESQGVVAVDIIKIDVQGFEGHVIAGLERTIRHSPRLVMLMEFWPLGLSSAGTDPVELLHRLDDFGLALYEVKAHGGFTRVDNRDELVNRLPGRKYTNLILLGPQAEWAP